MNNNLKNPANHKIACDICSKEFILKREHVFDKEVMLLQDLANGNSIPHKVMLTYLECPHCGKHYIVIMDDETTLPVLGELRGCMAKCYKYNSKGLNIPRKLMAKRIKLNRDLDAKRRELSETYRGSHYQLGECEYQLDYCYHAQ